jgi:nucleotide-binding universal stress UspA family protein
VHSFPELRVLVPLDGSPLAEAVLEPAAECAAALVRGVEHATMAPTGSIAAVLHLLLVVRPFIDALAKNVPETLIVSEAQKYLRQIAEQVRSAHPTMHVAWEVATAGDVAQYLVTRLQEDLEPARDRPGLTSEEAHALPPYTLLAMATHGRTGIIRWVWGSITERVVQKTELPLLLVRPEKPTGQTAPARERS